MERMADIRRERQDPSTTPRRKRGRIGMTQEEIAVKMGLTKQRIQQIEIEALRKMRVAFEALDSGTMEVADVELVGDMREAEERCRPATS